MNKTFVRLLTQAEIDRQDRRRKRLEILKDFIACICLFGGLYAALFLAAAFS